MPASSAAATASASRRDRPLLAQIGDLDGPALGHATNTRPIRVRQEHRTAAQPFAIRLRQRAMQRGHAYAAAVPQPHGAVARLADFGRLRHMVSKTGCNSPGDANDFEHFRGRRLLFQRFGQLGAAMLLGFEQPRVLDRDNGLVGEIFNKPMCLSAKRPTSLRVITIAPIGAPSRSIGTAEDTAPLTCHGDFARVVPVAQHILNLRDLAREDHPARGLVRLRGPWIHLPEHLNRLRWEIVMGDNRHKFAIKSVHSPHMRTTETHCVDCDVSKTV